MKKALICVLLILAALLIQGCGGHRTRRSAVSGTVSDINRNVVIDAEVWSDEEHVARTLVSGVYRLEGVASGWRTIRASAVINGKPWVGSTAAEVLRDEPTMNVNIVLALAGDTVQIGGIVVDDIGHRVDGARVLLTTRLVFPPEDTSAFDGPYSSIVAITDEDGHYLLEDVPVGLDAIISASKVGFENKEIEIVTSDDVVNFTLAPSDVQFRLLPPDLQAIESYTMPDVITITRSDEQAAFKAIRAFTSPRYRKAILGKQTVMTRATPPGSLIEIDLYWNAFGDVDGDANDSREVAGYSIYRTTSPSIAMTPIDFVRDPYANFYGDTGVEITPDDDLFYAVTAVDVEFLDILNRPDPNAESELSNTLSIIPLDQLGAQLPLQGDDVSGDPRFEWSPLSGADKYTVYLYDQFPTLPLDPAFDYGSDPVVSEGVLPIWPRRPTPDESTVGAGVDFKDYTGDPLIPGHKYYWVILAADGSETAFSYSELRNFTAR